MKDPIVANLILLGAMIEERPVVSADSMGKPIEATVSPEAIMLNIAAFRGATLRQEKVISKNAKLCTFTLLLLPLYLRTELA